MEGFEPKIIVFLCNWCSYGGGDLAGVNREQYPTNVIGLKVMCSSRVSPEHIMESFLDGADGVLITGCHPGDCHYIDGNYKTIRKVEMFYKVMDDMGIDPGRLRLEWISSAEGNRFASIMREMTEEVRALGPLNMAEVDLHE